MKTIRDRVSGHDVTINYVHSGESVVLTMCTKQSFERRTVRGQDKSMAIVAYAKGWLEGFGSFFERAEKAEAA